METQQLPDGQSSVYYTPPKPGMPLWAKVLIGVVVVPVALFTLAVIAGTILILTGNGTPPESSAAPAVSAPIVPTPAPAPRAKTNAYPSTIRFCNDFYQALGSGDVRELLSVGEWGANELDAGRLHPKVAADAGEIMIYVSEPGSRDTTREERLGQNIARSCASQGWEPPSGPTV